MRVAHVVLLASLGLAETTVSRRAHAQAQQPRAASVTRRDVVRLRTVARDGTSSDADARALEATVRELVGRLSLGVETERVPTTDAPTPRAGELSIVVVDLENPVGATVSIWDGAANREVVRRTVTRDRSPAIVVDEIAHIVQSSVEELADAQAKAAAPPAPAPTPAAPTPPPPAAPDERPREVPRVETRGTPTWGLDVGAFGAGRGYSSDTGVAFGGGVMLGLGLGRANAVAAETPRRGPEVWLGASVFAPVDASSAFVDASVSLLDARLVPTIEIWGGPRARLELGPEVAMEVAWTRAESATLPASRLAATSTRVSPLVGGAAIARFAVASTADVLVLGSLDVDLAPHRYVLQRSGANEPVLESWRVRPMLALGATFDLVGPALYARDVEGARP